MTPSPPRTPHGVFAHHGADANWDLNNRLFDGDVLWTP